MKTNPALRVVAEHPTLSPEQLKRIAELDGFRADGRFPEPVRRNVDESDITWRRERNQTWIYKLFESRRTQADPYVFCPTTGVIHSLSADQFMWLQTDNWRDMPEAVHDSLAALIRPFESVSWTFPSVPVNAAPPSLHARVLMLNPTEQCNIRCTYCYYGGAYEETRVHQTAAAPASATESAIDNFFADDRSLGDAQRAVYFFGGEPLMSFRRLRHAVEYLNQVVEDRGIDRDTLIVQVNSNGMLLTEEIVEFLVDHDIYLNISIDGPNHDRYRVDRRGKGTHHKVREKTDWLAANWPEYFSTRVALICVLSAPHNAKALYEYFADWPNALKALTWDFDLMLPGGSDSYQEFSTLFDELERTWDLFVQAHGLSAPERERSARYHFAFRHGFLHRSFHRILNVRQPIEDGMMGHLLGVELIPGAEVQVLGADSLLYSSYEFQSSEFIVGSAAEGADPTLGAAQLKTFRDAIQASECSTCWAAPVCTVAIAEAPYRPTDDAPSIERKWEAKRARCRSERENLVQALRAHEDIRHNFGDKALDSHRDDWAHQRLVGSRVDAFFG